MVESIAFLDYEIDLQRCELRRCDEPLHLEPRVFDVLTHLVENRHRVVTHQELIRAYWPGLAVSESALPRCISEARRLLGDRHRPHRVIATLRGRGYRFVASVHPRPAHDEVVVGDPRPEPFVGRTRVLATRGRSMTCLITGLRSVAEVF